MLTLEDEKWLQPNVRGGMLVDLAKYTNTVKKKLEVWELVLKKIKKLEKITCCWCHKYQYVVLNRMNENILFWVLPASCKLCP